MQQPLRDLQVIVLDCQTTGSSPDPGHLLEVGWSVTRASRGTPGPIVSHLVQPPGDQSIPHPITRLTGIADADLSSAIDRAALWSRLGAAIDAMLADRGGKRCARGRTGGSAGGRYPPPGASRRRPRRCIVLEHGRPRAARRRRGPEFFGSFERALQPALDGRVDLVIHGGDVFLRSRVGTGPVTRALEIIRSVTGKGVPFLVVPGNHERSRMPLRHLWRFPGLHLLDRPRSFRLAIRGLRADVRLLCVHHVVEGATVGPGGFTSRAGRDVIPGRLVPRAFAALLSGHIHRVQILRRDLRGRPPARRRCCAPRPCPPDVRRRGAPPAHS